MSIDWLENAFLVQPCLPDCPWQSNSSKMIINMHMELKNLDKALRRADEIEGKHAKAPVIPKGLHLPRPFYEANGIVPKRLGKNVLTVR